MFRVASTGRLCLLALSLCGCTSFFTTRAIESFTAGLAAGNLADLQASTSTEFQQRALRVAEAVESLAILPVPRDDWKVLEIQEISPDERLATVQVGKDDERPQTVQYRLKREKPPGEQATASPRWVVDDVILSQARPGGQPPLTKSVTEQMDLLITVQEFLKFWKAGSRDDALARLHPRLRAELEALPPAHFAQLTERTLQGAKLETFQPDARIQTSRATVQFPRLGGHLVLELSRLTEPEPRWAIEDVSLHSTRGGRPESVLQLARTVRQATDFLRAYESGDHDGLRRIATAEFYEQALSGADLETVPLPIPQLLTTRYELEEQDQRVDVLFDVGADTYLISMKREQRDVPALKRDGDETPVCRVEEVTIYERGGEQIKPLSVLFTAQAVVEVFAEALAERDLPLLAQLSTTEFNDSVWNRLAAPELMRGLPLDSFPDAPPQVATTAFQGPVTEITVTQGSKALTYVLHTTGGRPRIDDVLFPIHNRSGSLKMTLGALAPIYNFAWSWSRSDIDGLKQNSSEGLRRMIWSRTAQRPALNVALDQCLTPTLPRIETLGNDVIVTIGTSDRGLQARLVIEGARLMVEDLHVIGRELPDGKLELVSAMRDWINAEASKPTPRATSGRPRSSLLSPLSVAPAAAPGAGAATNDAPSGPATLEAGAARTAAAAATPEAAALVPPGAPQFNPVPNATPRAAAPSGPSAVPAASTTPAGTTSAADSAERPDARPRLQQPIAIPRG